MIVKRILHLQPKHDLPLIFTGKLTYQRNVPQFLGQSGEKFSFMRIVSIRWFETSFADDNAAGALTFFDLRCRGATTNKTALMIKLFR